VKWQFLWEIYEIINQCNSKLYFTHFSRGDDYFWASTCDWGNPTCGPEEGFSRLIQTLTQNLSHDGHESKGHLKIVLKAQGGNGHHSPIF
jgi:hypothetical protein